jgi:conserved domain protein
MKKLRLCDNKYLEGDEEKKLNELQELKERIVDKKLGKLMEEGVFIFPNSFESVADIDENQKILERQNDIYRTGNVMGFLGYKDERLTITSRFSNEEDYFVQYLMMRALELPNFLDLEIDTVQNNNMFNFLLFLFPYFLKRALRKTNY